MIVVIKEMKRHLILCLTTAGEPNPAVYSLPIGTSGLTRKSKKLMEKHISC